MARRVAEIMEAEKGLGVRIVDLRTVRPLDEVTILKSAEECGRIIILTEDRFLGGAGPTIASLITSGEAINYLEAPVKVVTAIDARVAYGIDGDDICLPNNQKIIEAIEEIMNY